MLLATFPLLLSQRNPIPQERITVLTLLQVLISFKFQAYCTAYQIFGSSSFVLVSTSYVPRVTKEMVEKGREDHGSGRLVPGICRRLFNFFMSFLTYYLHKPVTLGATNFSESPSGAAEPFTGKRKGSIQATQDKGLINLELQRITPKISVANGLSGHARRHKAKGQGVPGGPNTSSNMGEGKCVDIVIERGKWKVEEENSSSFASMLGHDKKRESTKSVTYKKEKGASREKQEERRGVMIRRPLDAKKEMFDIDERSEHFIRQRRAAMRAGSDVEQSPAESVIS